MPEPDKVLPFPEKELKRHQKVALIGNPNVGKSVLFGLLGGRYVSVSNYPGTTVEIARIETTLDGEKISIWDTPGVHLLTPMSEAEKVTRDILLSEGIDAVIHVADAKNLRRSLLLSLELAEMGIPFLLNLNMEDESAARGIQIDKQELSSLLGVPVIGTIATKKIGIDELKNNIRSAAKAIFPFHYSSEIETAINRIEAKLPSSRLTKRSVALMLIAGDETLHDWLSPKIGPVPMREIGEIRKELVKNFAEPLLYHINRERLRRVDEILEKVMNGQSGRKTGWLERFGNLSMHPVGGFVVLTAVLYALYQFVGKVGAQIGVDWFERLLFGRYLNPWAKALFASLFSNTPLVQDLFVGPYGLITMGLTYAFGIIFPIVLTFFIFFGIMEDSGYLPRLAVMLNRLFRFMGLNGKAVIPMVLGLGCDTMATLTSRIMETKKERVILTLLLALGVPCSAQLGIILGMFRSLPPWAPLLWGGVVGGVMIMAGFLASRVLSGERSDFIAEIPPIRRPLLRNSLQKTVARLEWYLKEVTPLFLLATLFLFLIDRLRFMGAIQNAASPLVVGLLDLPRESIEVFLAAFFRRDYAATYFFNLFNKGLLDSIQAVVALIVLTLFIPCLANLLIIVKERGARAAATMVGLVYLIAFTVGGVVNYILRL
ncbi:MAG: ferrous iron transport protein B [Deltaproteobacteria bacterium]|nr:ferrous iron transport protein B [Deltaproteobacteria bacterium]